jgi:hypothetical protein
VITDQVIVASNRPWCFSARTNQIVVQVSDKFRTSIEVLFNYLVICFFFFFFEGILLFVLSLCIECSKLFQLEGEY